MATVLNRTTKELRSSVNTPDFPVTEWIINPDLSAVKDFLPKHWNIVGDTVSLMDKTERDAVDMKETADIIAEDRVEEKDRLNRERILKALALTLLQEINNLRFRHGLSPRAQTQLITAVKAKVDEI